MEDTLVGFGNWLDDRGITETGGGRSSGVGGPGHRWAALGQQGGVLGSKRAVQPLVGYGLTAEEHFAAAQAVGATGILPSDADVAVAYDLRYAAEVTIRQRAALRRPCT